jgi:hypothetical protein
MGSMHAVQSKAKDAPINNAPPYPNFLFFNSNLASLKKKKERMRPILKIPKKMIINPAIFVRREAFDIKKAPIHVADSPLSPPYLLASELLH